MSDAEGQLSNPSEEASNHVESDDQLASSNEALPLLTEPKRRKLSSSPSFASSSSFGMQFSDFPVEESKPLDTETIAKEVRAALHQKLMRQTDLAPFIGCRPGSVAGVIAKAKVPWSQLNEFNRNVYSAMAKWLEDCKKNPDWHFISSSAASSSSLSNAAVSPDVVNSSTSPPVTPLTPFLIPNYSKPWATAKCTPNPAYLLFLENIYMAVPGRDTLLAGANLSLASPKKYAIVGPSECGTSMLLRFIAAKRDLNIPVELEIVACDQSSLDLTSDNMPDNVRTIDYVLDLDQRWRKLKAEEAVLEICLKNGDSRVEFPRLRRIYEQLCFFGSGDAVIECRRMLTGLGFSLEAQDGLVKDLSVRSRKVAALARALFSQPPLLLIDRPTNFLDVDSIVWLETYLKSAMITKRRVVFCVLDRVQRRFLSKKAPSMLVADMLGNFEVQSQSKVHAQLRRFIPEATLPESPVPNIYGGEILANCLLGAARILTTAKYQQPSSLSVEFMRPGVYDCPLEFSVTKMFESHRFMQANVFVKQNEKCIALSNVSFHYEKPGPDTLIFDPSFPQNIPSPDEVPFADVAFEQMKRELNMLLPSADFHLAWSKALGVQVKPINPNAYLAVNKNPVVQNRFWVRVNPVDVETALPSLGESWSAAILAYMSDFYLLWPALSQRPGFRISKIVSLNHATWFLANRTLTRPAEWVLMDHRLIHSGNNLVLCEGYMWSEDKKRLLAISKQQGLVRPQTKKAPKSDN